MDMSSVHQAKSQNMKRGRRKTNNNNKKSVKVVYISTPVKVNTTVSKFRALVQELTGRDSDMSRFGDIDAELSEKSWEHEDEQKPKSWEIENNHYDNQVMVSYSDVSEKSWEHEDEQKPKSWEIENNHYDNQVMVSNSEVSQKSWEHEDDQHQIISNNNNYDVIRPVIREFMSLETLDQDLSYDYSPTSSESLLDSFDDVVSSQMVEELEQMFPSSLFGYESSVSHQNYVLGDSGYGLV